LLPRNVFTACSSLGCRRESRCHGKYSVSSVQFSVSECRLRESQLDWLLRVGLCFLNSSSAVHTLRVNCYESLDPRQIVSDDGFGILHLGRVAPADLCLSAQPRIFVVHSAGHSSGCRPARTLVPFFTAIAHSERLPPGGNRGDVLQQSICGSSFLRGEIP